MQIQNFRCSGCGREGRGKIVPDNWLLWVPFCSTGENHNDLEERNGNKYYCEKCGPTCSKCEEPVIKTKDRPRRIIDTKTYLHTEGNRPIFSYTTIAFHENCYHQYCQEEAKEKKKIEEKAEKPPLANEFEAEPPGSLIKSHKFFVHPIDFNQLGKGLLLGAILMFEFGLPSAVLGLILAVIFDWSWFWGTTAIGMLAGFLLGVDAGYSKSHYRSSND